MKIDEALNRCLDDLRSGRSLEECLRAYPEHAVELEPLLRSALALSSAPTSSARFRRELGDRLAVAWEGRRRQHIFWAPGRVWAVALALALAFLVSGAGTVWAASSAAPGDVLYPAKRAAEGVRQVLPTSKRSKADLQMQLAGRRVQEMAKVLKRDRAGEMEHLLARLEAHLSKAEGLAAHERAAHTLARLRLRLERDADLGLAQLWREMERMPEAKRARVRALLERADLRYEQTWWSFKKGEMEPAPMPLPPPWRRPRLNPGGLDPPRVPVVPFRRALPGGASLIPSVSSAGGGYS